MPVLDVGLRRTAPYLNRFVEEHLVRKSGGRSQGAADETDQTGQVDLTGTRICKVGWRTRDGFRSIVPVRGTSQLAIQPAKSLPIYRVGGRMGYI